MKKSLKNPYRDRFNKTPTVNLVFDKWYALQKSDHPMDLISLKFDHYDDYNDPIFTDTSYNYIRKSKNEKLIIFGPFVTEINAKNFILKRQLMYLRSIGVPV